MNNMVKIDHVLKFRFGWGCLADFRIRTVWFDVLLASSFSFMQIFYVAYIVH